MTASQLKALKTVCDYIFQHEQEDFYENPSDTHVYYWAYVADEGLRAANMMLTGAEILLKGVNDANEG